MVNRQSLEKQKFRKSLRVLHGLTLYDIAQRLNRSTSYAHCVEAGKVRPTRREARKIAQILDTDVSALFPDLESTS